MSRLTELMGNVVANKMLGGAQTSATPGGDGGGETQQLPPFIQNLLRNFGITPEAITAYAEAIKNGVEQIRYNTQLAVDQNSMILVRLGELETSIALGRSDTQPASLAPIPAFDDGAIVTDELLVAIGNDITDKSKHN